MYITVAQGLNGVVRLRILTVQDLEASGPSEELKQEIANLCKSYRQKYCSPDDATDDLSSAQKMVQNIGIEQPKPDLLQRLCYEE